MRCSKIKLTLFEDDDVEVPFVVERAVVFVGRPGKESDSIDDEHDVVPGFRGTHDDSPLSAELVLSLTGD